MKPRTLFILHLHNAIEEIHKQEHEKKQAIAQNKPFAAGNRLQSVDEREKHQGRAGCKTRNGVTVLYVNSPTYTTVLLVTKHLFFTQTYEIEQKMFMSKLENESRSRSVVLTPVTPCTVAYRTPPSVVFQAGVLEWAA